GVSMIENAPGTRSTVTIKRTPTGFEEDTIVIDTKEKIGNFAGTWSVREENGSLQLVEVAPPAPSRPISWTPRRGPAITPRR
ncbi:hypothetical protein M1466_02755, partial [Candidatus Dependentiae bacterium]|nr:hypothetical protein [Candidatus Dependentiae bacterium]